MGNTDDVVPFSQYVFGEASARFHDNFSLLSSRHGVKKNSSRQSLQVNVAYTSQKLQILWIVIGDVKKNNIRQLQNRYNCSR